MTTLMLMMTTFLEFPRQHEHVTRKMEENADRTSENAQFVRDSHVVEKWINFPTSEG
jgi:hypothetical protein